MTGPDATISTIESLSDPHAVRALRQFVRSRGGAPDRDGETVEHLREAVADPALAAYLEPADRDADEADLARATLIHLATAQPGAVDAIDAAVEAAETPAGYDPLTIAVGGLVLVALQTEVDLTKSDDGRWRLRIHKQAMRDSTLAKLLAKLISIYRPDGK